MSTNYGFEPTLDGLNNVDADSSTTTNIICDTITVNTSSSVPTRTAGDSTTNIANTAFVTNAISTAGGSYVTLAGIQTISGQKTFSSATTYITGDLDAPTIKTSLGTSMTIATDPSGFTDDIDITTANDLTLTAGFNAVIDCFQGNFNATNAMTFSSGSNINFNGVGSVFNGTNLSFNNTGGSTVFNYVLPSCSIAPTSGNDLCNKNYVDSNFVDKTTTQTITGAKTFSTNTLTASAGITVKNGASAQTATLTQNATTLDVIGVGDISIKPTNDFNVVTGTGKDITVSTPDSALLPSTQTYTTGILNTGSSIAFQSPTTYILGISTQPSLIMSGGFGTIYGWQFTRGGTATSAINRINSQNTLDTCYLEVNEGQNITLTNGVTSITGDFLIQQTTYPPSNNSAMGYTDSENTLTDPMNNTLTARSNFDLPSKGVWLIICGYEWRTNTSNTVEAKQIVLSTTSGGSTPAAYGLQYYEEINDAAGAAGGRQTGTISGVVRATALTTIYVNARSQVSSGTNTEFETSITWTRIG